jgi:hypothetical protein
MPGKPDVRAPAVGWDDGASACCSGSTGVRAAILCGPARPAAIKPRAPARSRQPCAPAGTVRPGGGRCGLMAAPSLGRTHPRRTAARRCSWLPHATRRKNASQPRPGHENPNAAGSLCSRPARGQTVSGYDQEAFALFCKSSQKIFCQCTRSRHGSKWGQLAGCAGTGRGAAPLSLQKPPAALRAPLYYSLLVAIHIPSESFVHGRPASSLSRACGSGGVACPVADRPTEP